MFRGMIISAVAAAVGVQFAFGSSHVIFAQAQASTSPAGSHMATWATEVWIDLLILGCFGLAGGFLSLVAIPFKSAQDAVIRVVCGGLVSALFAGAVIVWAGMDASHPSMRMAVAGLAGFFSYPALQWFGKKGFGWALSRMGIPDTVKEDKSSSSNTPGDQS